MKTIALEKHENKDGLIATMGNANSSDLELFNLARATEEAYSRMEKAGEALNSMDKPFFIEQSDQRFDTQLIEPREGSTSSFDNISQKICVDHFQETSKCIQDMHDASVRRRQFSLISLSLQEEDFTKSAERISELVELQDFEEGEKPLSLESVQNFQKFIRDFTVLGEPRLGIFPEGTLSAGWRLADNKHLLLEFLENDEVSFAMIGPDDEAADGKFRLNGRGSKRSVLESLNNNNIPQWPE